MLKKLILLLLILPFVSTFSQEQSLKAQLISTQKIDADEFVGIDGLRSIYYLKNHVFYKKYNEEVWQYKNTFLGEITRIDLQNPLRIVLFYENFNTAILLDNQLNETKKINFSENSASIIVSAIGIASQNRLWIYNNLSEQVGLFDYLKNTYQAIIPYFLGNLKYYYSDFNTFQWVDWQLNWYSCDVYGKVTLLGKLTDFDQIQIIGHQVVVFCKDGKLYWQDTSKNSIHRIENIDKSFKNFYYKDQILSTFTSQEITNYKIITP